MADEEDGWIEAYDIKHLEREPRPDLAAYTAAFYDLTSEIENISNMLQKPLLRSKFQNNMTKALLKEIQDRMKDATTCQTMFAVSGAMDAGTMADLLSLDDRADT